MVVFIIKTERNYLKHVQKKYYHIFEKNKIQDSLWIDITVNQAEADDDRN